MGSLGHVGAVGVGVDAGPEATAAIMPVFTSTVVYRAMPIIATQYRCGVPGSPRTTTCQNFVCPIQMRHHGRTNGLICLPVSRSRMIV